MTTLQTEPTMDNFKKYVFEYVLVVLVILLAVTGFWAIYFGSKAHPTPYQNFHVIVNFIWLFLVLYQLSLIGSKQYIKHRKVGLAVLFFGPLLFASTALLSVYSAHKGLVSGEGDILIVQNVMVTLELGFLLLMAFILKKRRKLHGAFLLSTIILFMGIALFFSLLSFVPQFKIEGPETFYRFGTAAVTAQIICLVIGLIFFVKDRRNGWPLFMAAAFFPLNQYINTLLIKYKLIQPLTEFVGSLSQTITFTGSFIILLILLTFTGVRIKRAAGS